MITPVQHWVGQCTGLTENLTAETLGLWQLDRVKKAVEYAKSNSAYYSRRLKSIDVEKIRTLQDLEVIPFTWPEDIIQDSRSLVCVPEQQIARITTLSTSGSTGKPKRIYFTENDLERTIDFFAEGMTTMVRSGQSVLIMMSSPTEHSIADLLQKGLNRIGVFSVIHGNVKDIPKALAAVKGFDCLVGVPAEILYLCRTDAGIRPESVLLSADYVPESVIKAITETWKCKVYTHYGMTETGFGGGVQCAAGLGYHLRDADFLVEIVDSKTGEQMPNGEYGEVVLTTLRNEAMPLIRYRIGDIARMLDDSCPCGGVLPCLDKVQGRVVNNISLANGQSFSIHKLDESMFDTPGVRGYQAQLTEGKVLTITIDTLLPHLTESLTGQFPWNIETRIKYDHVPPFTGGGKRRIILE